MKNVKKYFNALICLAVTSMTVFPACTPDGGDYRDPNDNIELKPFTMLISDETSENNYYPFGIFAPIDWTQTGYDLSFTDGFDIYDYFQNEGYGEFYSLPFELYSPILSLRGTDGEYAYGYADFGSSTVTADLSLNEYLDLFLRANNYERPQTVNEITMTTWTPTGEKLKGLSFDKEISASLTERIVIFKTEAYGNGGTKAFGVFRIGCDTEDFGAKRTLFDRMEKEIFGCNVWRTERYENSYFEDVKTADYSALGLKMKLPREYSPFTVSQFPAYGNSYGKIYDVWGNDQGYHLEDAGEVKIEIYRDPVVFSEVFAPIKNLYDLHSEYTYEMSVAPPMLTTLSNGTIAVYSAHNSFKNFERICTTPAVPDNFSMHVEEATRKIVYTFIHGEYIYNVLFTLTYNPVYDISQVGECGPHVNTAMSMLNSYEEYFVFRAMDSLTFN